MPTSQTIELDRVFAALAHPVRRAILAQCGESRQSIAELAKPHEMSLNAISKHVKTLEDAKLVTRRVEGNVHRIGVHTGSARMAIDWLSYHVNLWDESLNALRKQLESDA